MTIPVIQISNREIIKICREFGARDPELCYHSVQHALRAGRDPDILFANLKRNRPDLFYKN